MRLLQSFDFRASPYERPNQRWVCGHRGEGEGCRLGPDRRGRCRTTAECTPRQDGALWVCTRSKRAGGTCAEGPGPNGECGRPVVPCQPVRSVRAKRGLVVRWATAVTIGVVLMALFGNDAATWVSPGPLTGHHSEIESCATCHDDFGGGPEGWLHAAVSGVDGAKAGDSQQCLACHETGDKPFNPHSLPAARLAELAPENGAARAGETAMPAALSVARESFAKPHKAGDGALACADCHSEHEGASARITAMSDQQCQVCHATGFRSFDKGHPDIAGFAYGRRTRINFDHVRHMKRHFEEADDAPKQCTACHVTAAGGATMQTRGFQATCASCHSGDVRGTKAAGAPGVPVITVPGLDVLTLREKDIAIGAWPETADRELSPFMRAMLADDKATRRALTRFRNLDAMDLREAGKKDLQAVKTVAWAVKALIYDLIANGPASLKPALATAFGREISTEDATRMVAGMPLDTLRAAQREWFPDLASEIHAHRNGERVPIPKDELAAASDGESGETSTSGSGESGDSILGGDGGSGSNGAGGDDSILGGDGGGSATDSGGDSILGGDSNESSGGEGGGANGGESILGGDSSSGSDGGDSGGESILGGDSSSGADGGDSGDILSGDESGGGDGGGGGDSILGGDDDGGDSGGDLLGGGSDGGSDGGADGGAGDAADKTTETATMPEPEPGSWTELGGWYRDYFAVLYRPGGHADPFVKTWLDVAGDGYGGSPGGVAKAVVDRVGQDKGPGRCIKCHSIDSTGSGLRVNWNEKAPPRVSQFTSFTHDPHLTQVRADAGCATCHEFAPDNAYLASFDDRDPETFESNFQAITTADCATCHVDGAAGNACTQCHAYHVGKTPMSDVPTRMDEMSMSDGPK